MQRSPCILYIAHYYPPAPQHFLADEITRWSDHGLDLAVLAIRPPDPQKLSLMPQDVRDEVHRTTYYSALSLGTWARGLLACLRHPGRALNALIRGSFGRYRRENTWRHRAHAFLTAWRSIAVLGFFIRGGFTRVHCDFADDTATIGLILRRIAGIPFSFRDYFSFNPQLIKEKVTAAEFVLACSECNRMSLLNAAPRSSGDRIFTDYLGVDLKEWVPSPLPDGPRVITVGNLQEKKGHTYLIKSIRLLRSRGIPVFCTFVGDGLLRQSLEEEIAAADLSDFVEITGYVSKGRVQELMSRSRICCLPAVIASNGDTDGVPFVLMEAMAMARPCVSTSIGGIDEVIRDGKDGFIVQQRDAEELADALETLLTNPHLAEGMARSSRHRAEHILDIDRNTYRTARLFSPICRASDD